MRSTALPALLLAVVLAACSPPGAAPGTLQLDRLQGRWVVINYWAQWCKPCIKEIPELNRLARQDPRLVVLGVNFDGATGAELERQVTALGIAFPLLLEDPAPALGIERPAALPTTVIVNPEGVIRSTLVGPQTEDSLLAATLGADRPGEGPGAPR